MHFGGHRLSAELLLDGGGLAPPSLHRAVVRHITKGGIVIRGHEIHSRGGPKGRVQTYLQTWWCLVLTEAVVQEVFDLFNCFRRAVETPLQETDQLGD
jgi:hypothetical protein